MKLRWSSNNFVCRCGKEVRTGQLAYICMCCATMLCTDCVDHKYKQDLKKSHLYVKLERK